MNPHTYRLATDEERQHDLRKRMRALEDAHALGWISDRQLEERTAALASFNGYPRARS